MAIANSDGLPLAISIAAGNRFETKLVVPTLEAAFVDRLPGKLIGDKAYDSAPLVRELKEQRNIELIAPTRKGLRPSRRKQDGRALRRYKRRWKVERLFAWLKRMRRISTRWDVKANNFLGLILLGCIIIMLRGF